VYNSTCSFLPGGWGSGTFFWFPKFFHSLSVIAERLCSCALCTTVPPEILRMCILTFVDPVKMSLMVITYIISSNQLILALRLKYSNHEQRIPFSGSVPSKHSSFSVCQVTLILSCSTYLSNRTVTTIAKESVTGRLLYRIPRTESGNNKQTKIESCGIYHHH
jgi:hypothetical protein